MQGNRDGNAFQLIYKVYKAYHKYQKAQARQVSLARLTVPQFSVLELLKKHGQSTTKLLSEELMVAKPNITCIIDNLEKQNLVKRIKSEGDRRIVYLELTRPGLNKLEQIWPKYVEHISSLAANLSKDELKSLIDLLDKFNSDSTNLIQRGD